MNPKITVVMPTLKRPELLALALESLGKTPEANHLDVRIYIDTTSDKQLEEVDWVRDNYYPDALLFRAGLHVMAPSGCWNILNSWKQGYESGADFVCLVEEDVIVKRDFFSRHLEMQNRADYFATCGRQWRDQSWYYTNPGSCIKREKLALIVPHINLEYFADRRGYLTRNFGSFEDASDLDDGLIRHIQRSINGIITCAVPRIASHVGFHYYQKFSMYQNNGTIQQRIQWARDFLSDVPARKKEDPRYLGDLEEL